MTEAAEKKARTDEAVGDEKVSDRDRRASVGQAISLDQGGLGVPSDPPSGEEVQGAASAKQEETTPVKRDNGPLSETIAARDGAAPPVEEGASDDVAPASTFTLELDSESLKLIPFAEAGSATGACFYSRTGQRTVLGVVNVAAGLGFKQQRLVMQGQRLPGSMKGLQSGDVMAWTLQHATNHTVSFCVWNPQCPDEFRMLTCGPLKEMAAQTGPSTFHQFSSQLEAEKVMAAGYEVVRMHHERPAAAVAMGPVPVPRGRSAESVPDHSSKVNSTLVYQVDGTDLFAALLQGERLTSLESDTGAMAEEVEALRAKIETLLWQVG
jgi:hypothetical protein